MTDKRGIQIHFMDGSKMNLEFPRQTPNESAAVMRLREVLNARQMLVEADGALMIIPFENIKYIQAYPAPTKLPENTIKAASFTA